MSSDFTPPPPPPAPPRPPAIPPPPPPAPLRGNTPPPSTGNTVPPLSFSLTPFPPPPPPVTHPVSPLTVSAPSPAPTSSPPPPPPRRSQLSPKARLVLIAGTTALVLLIAAALTWAHLRKRVPESELIAWLHAHSDAGLTIEKLTKTVTPQSDGSSLIAFEARGTVPAALYVRENTASHLRRTLDLSPASPSVVREAATSAADIRIRERAAVSDTPVDLLETIVLRETTAAGKEFSLSGVATARRVDGHWRFSLLEGSLSSPALEGQPRATFGEKTYLAGNPDDDATLKQLVENQTDAIARLEKAAAEIAEENKRAHESRLTRLHDRLPTGALIIGTATVYGKSEDLSLEITAAKPGSHKISALLRNSSGWTDARPFSGTWTLDDTTGVFSFTLTSRTGEAIASAGPLLETPSALTLAFTLTDEDVVTSASDSATPFNATLVAPEKLAATKAKLTARLDTALEATRPDTIYHGTATPKTGDATAEKIFLRFTKQTDHGTSLTAFFESAEAGTTAKRALRGSITDNSRRAANHPIRLQMPGSGRSRSARPGTLFAHVADTTLALKIDGTRLTGEDAAFTYEFTRVSAAQAATLKKTVEANSAALAASLPRTSGVHVQIDEQWTALPRNGGSTSGGIGGFAKGLFSRKDAEKPAVLVFKGSTPPAVVSGKDLVLTFKGKIPSRAKGVATDYPLIEAARTNTQEDGTRTASLERITPGFAGFGATRLTATIAQPAADILTLTFEQTLAPGTYAVLVGTDGYEFMVK